MPVCPRGHNSDADDYCDVCGDLMSAAPSAAGTTPGVAGEAECPHCGTPRNGRFCEVDGYDFEYKALPRAAPPEPGATGQTTQLLQDPLASFAPPPPPPQPQSHPQSPPPTLSPPQATPPVSPTPPLSPPPSPSPTQQKTSQRDSGAQSRPKGQAGSEAGRAPDRVSSPTGWSVLVAADRDYYEAMMALGGPEAAALTFPPYSPERWLPLIGERVRIGRRSTSRAIFPEIDLSAPPEDPGVSHLHAVLLAQPDGTWVLVDPGSTNGTTVNGATDPIAVNVPVPVGAGDRIHVGAWTTITLFLEGENRR